MEKTYTEPKFTFVSTDNQSKVFFAASGGGLGAILSNITKTGGSW